MRCSPHRTVRIVRLSVLCVCACATSGIQSNKQVTSAPRNDAATTTPEWREMTWSEYHDSVMRNARKRGAMVIWVNGPELRTVPRNEPPTTATPAPSAE
ncbi:MAG TPA: hypothetical protein VJR89_12595 [Polyangiales bacterium]|nr:hypothetical protein [Polyangiales bacterium]